MSTEVVSVRLPPELIAQLRHRADLNDRTLSREIGRRLRLSFEAELPSPPCECDNPLHDHGDTP